MASSHSDTLDLLRDRIARMGSEPARSVAQRLSTGVAEIDARLGGGLEKGTVHEFFGAGSDRQVSAKPSRFVAAVLARTTGAVIWIGEEHLDLCVAGVEQAGLNPGRLICVTATQASFVDLCEAVLREPGVAAVVADSRAAPDLNATRRLQLAAHERGVTGFLLYRSTFLGSGASRCLSATRWKIAPSTTFSLRDNTAAGPYKAEERWSIEMLSHHHGGVAGWVVDPARYETHPFSVTPQYASHYDRRETTRRSWWRSALRA
ncbi:ImuA family protein [Acetobacter persici]|uniref:ImuA family protein n=1 Tax=Acetobacter persici TaxID=1076596 RepID=UPI0036DDCFF3